MIITSTGYYGTGSSAIYDLLKEYSSCSQGVFKDVDYEHLVLYTPNGLFDLEDKLLIGNNIHRSDEAINSLRSEMEKLYYNNFIWFGNFKHYFGRVFLDAVDEFTNSITDAKVESTWYYDYIGTKFSIKRVIKNSIKTLLHKEYVGDFSKRIIMKNKNCISYSFVKPDIFYKEANQFINKYIALSTTEKDKNLILDHFLLPHNLYRLKNYFDDDFRVFVVERDPRDVYIQYMNQLKYRVASIPLEINDYINFWKNLRECEQKINDSRICKIYFEDLIYYYDETVSQVENFCGLDSAEHLEVKKYFIPSKSIKNTKLYLNNSEYSKQIKIIEHDLPEYLYLR